MTKKYDELDQAFDVSSTEIESTPVEPIVEEKIENIRSQSEVIVRLFEARG